MRAGRLKDKIEIITTGHDNGLTAPTQSTISRRAEVVPVSIKDRAAAGVVLAAAEYKITLRYIAGVDTSNKIGFDGRVFNISHCMPDRRKTFLTLFVSSQ